MEKLKISVIAPFNRPWSDVELVKECIVLPFLLYKNHDCDVTIVGASPEGVPSGSYDAEDDRILSDGYYKNYKYISGLKFKLFDTWDYEARENYIYQNIHDIDILYLRGPYKLNLHMAPLFKQLKPEGTVICALDANSSWMDKIYWYLPEYMNFLNSCDIITTSCTAMANFLSIKWPWHVHSIINGFYDLSIDHKQKVRFTDRENIILTVGRLGTKQKCNDVLLEAFAQAAASIPDWKLYLVGSIDDQFIPYLDEYLERNKAISDRIIFTGSISDRDELADFYDRAKIYALTSELEGGTNNATAEALGRGLIPITSRIDAYEDITDHERIGCSFEIGDIDALAGILISLCNSEDLDSKSEQVYEYADKEYNMEKITGRLYELIKRNKP